VIGHVPLGRWKTITFVAALRQNKIAAPMVVEGAMNGGGDIVVMDNLQAHTRQPLQPEAIGAVGACSS